MMNAGLERIRNFQSKFILTKITRRRHIVSNITHINFNAIYLHQWAMQTILTWTLALPTVRISGALDTVEMLNKQQSLVTTSALCCSHFLKTYESMIVLCYICETDGIHRLTVSYKFRIFHKSPKYRAMRQSGLSRYTSNYLMFCVHPCG